MFRNGKRPTSIVKASLCSNRVTSLKSSKRLQNCDHTSKTYESFRFPQILPPKKIGSPPPQKGDPSFLRGGLRGGRWGGVGGNWFWRGYQENHINN